jgi:FKBP-type peptidyl-prolyl cis-trans isomerase
VVGTGDGPKAGDNVKVHYTGKLLDGKVFDSSKNGGRPPIDFQVGVGMVIPGWEEGIMLMKKGGKRTLIIPSGLAYGAEGSPGAIPANSVLLFDVELLDFGKAPAQPAGPPTR